jgi:endonuclease/exonuclease/phosphatase family metal-dependent hydrolase
MLIVTYNIQWGRGRDGRIDLDRIAATVAAADIIALQEVERHWRPQAFPDQVARLSGLLPDRHSVFGPSIDLGGAEPKAPRRQFGNMILSRWPIVATRTFPLQSQPVAGEFNDQSSVLEAVIEAPGGAIRLYNTHLTHLVAGGQPDQARHLLQIIEAAGRHGTSITAPGRSELGPEDDWLVLPNGMPPSPASAVLAGDFNAGPGDATWQMLAEQFTDAIGIAPEPSINRITFPGGGLALDHIFLTADLAKGCRRAWVDASAQGSDHQPVWVLLDQASQKGTVTGPLDEQASTV